MSKTDRAAKTETAFRLFDKNKDGFITREDDIIPIEILTSIRILLI